MPNKQKKITYCKPAIISPYQVGTGGVACRPLMSNVPVGGPGWVLTTCPVCGRECWETPQGMELMAKDPTVRAACTLCALAGKYGSGEQ